MNRFAIPAVLSACVLAGCGGQSTMLQPGQWETNVAIVRLEAPGMPKGANVPLPPPTTTSSCLTPEQARNPDANFAAGNTSGCSSEDYRMADGRISGTLTCNQQGTSMRATLAGTYTPTTMDMTMNSQTQAAGQNVTTEVRVTGRRTGDCRSGS
jgi:hypothetical protein